MKAGYSKQFLRQYTKLPPKIRQKADDRLRLWQADRFDPLLRDHQLKGELQHYRSIDITGDYRALYSVNDHVALFET
ncbi:MAG TPA: type II toxin-antitoxin system mRNA interferase toxin, RelE/StbE family, partial [Candidatus Saccharimonadales bacterium]